MPYRSPEIFIRHRFSRAAPRYAGLAFLQREIAGEVAAGLALAANVKVLDVGTGSGFLLEHFWAGQKDAALVGLDASRKMLKAARAACPSALLVQGDACCLPFRDNMFDMVVSSSSYQWVRDLGTAFRDAGRVLRPGGIFRSALFGRDTLKEFFEVLEGVLPAGTPVPARLASVDEARAALASGGFSGKDLSSGTREVTFHSVWALLQWLKAVGANSLAEKFFLGPKLLRRLENAYVSRYGGAEGVRVNFEIIWIRAKK